MTLINVLHLASNISMFGLFVCILINLVGPSPQSTFEKKIAVYHNAHLARLGIIFFSVVYLASMFAKEFAL